MARAIRVEYVGAVYHVMSRGNNGQEIFCTDKDRERLLQTLEDACEQTGWVVHAYVLMSNHYHVLLETPEANLVVGMKWFQGTYTQRFNRANDRCGHLFQGRYRSLLVDPENPAYFSTVSTYIHLNPVRAGLCALPGDYPWSSCKYYGSNASKRPEWLDGQRVVDCFAFPGGIRKRSAAYVQYMTQRAAEELDPQFQDQIDLERKELRRGWIMGGEDFRKRVLDMLETMHVGQSDNFRSEQRTMHGKSQANVLLGKALGQLDLDESELLSLRSSMPEKQAVAWLLKKHTVVTGVWIAERLNMGHRMNVSRSIKRFNQSTDPVIEELRQKMLQCSG